MLKNEREMLLARMGNPPPGGREVKITQNNSKYLKTTRMGRLDGKCRMQNAKWQESAALTIFASSSHKVYFLA
jgi:hypothetical protein